MAGDVVFECRCACDQVQPSRPSHARMSQIGDADRRAGQLIRFALGWTRPATASEDEVAALAERDALLFARRDHRTDQN